MTALLGHAPGSITIRSIRNVATSLIMAADTVAGYIAAVPDGVEFKHRSYPVDHASRRSAMADIFVRTVQLDLAPKAKPIVLWLDSTMLVLERHYNPAQLYQNIL
jgi:hypothetical protein